MLRLRKLPPTGYKRWERRSTYTAVAPAKIEPADSVAAPTLTGITGAFTLGTVAVGITTPVVIEAGFDAMWPDGLTSTFDALDPHFLTPFASMDTAMAAVSATVSLTGQQLTATQGSFPFSIPVGGYTLISNVIRRVKFARHSRPTTFTQVGRAYSTARVVNLTGLSVAASQGLMTVNGGRTVVLLGQSLTLGRGTVSITLGSNLFGTVTFTGNATVLLSSQVLRVSAISFGGNATFTASPRQRYVGAVSFGGNARLRVRRGVATAVQSMFQQFDAEQSLGYKP